MGTMDEDKVSDDNYGFAIGRGRGFVGGLPGTPVRTAANVDSPAFCSTRLPGHAAASLGQEDTFPATTDPALTSLITHIAQQVGQTIREHLRGGCGERDVSGTQAQSSAGQPPRDSTYLSQLVQS